MKSSIDLEIAHGAAGELRSALAEAGWRGFARLRRVLRESSQGWRALARQLHSIAWEARDDYERRAVRFGVVSDASTANIHDALLIEGLVRGIIPVQYHGRSSSASRELRDPESGLYRHQPDIVVLAASHRASAERGEAYLDELLEDIGELRRRTPAVVLVHGLTPTELPGGGGRAAETCARMNLALSDRLRGLSDVRMVDVFHLVALSGSAWWTLHRGWFLAHLAVPEEAAPLIAREYAAVGAALRGYARKCLVVDLDDTLWGGSVGEMGVDGIEIGPGYPANIYRAIQEIVCRLHAAGVVLAVNSHNNVADAWAPFDHRPEMLLGRDRFAAWRINWQDKARNLEEIAADLRLGLDSLVMLENDPRQQAWIEEALPQVHVIGAADPLEMVRALATQRLFDGLGGTAEDAIRSRSLAAAARRQQAEAVSHDRRAFLSSLGLTVEIGRGSRDTQARLAQLTQRTNQLNMTTRRYTEGQIAELCSSGDVEVIWCACRDRYADDGITGLAILRGPGDEWLIDTLLVSCRVLGRGVEQALVAGMCRVARDRGVRALRGDFIPTARNAPAAAVYRDAGFVELEAGPDGSTAWRLHLPPPRDPTPAWIDLRMAGERP